MHDSVRSFFIRVADLLPKRLLLDERSHADQCAKTPVVVRLVVVPPGNTVLTACATGAHEVYRSHALLRQLFESRLPGQSLRYATSATLYDDLVDLSDAVAADPAALGLAPLSLIGNAVPPLLARALAKRISEQLGDLAASTSFSSQDHVAIKR